MLYAQDVNIKHEVIKPEILNNKNNKNFHKLNNNDKEVKPTTPINKSNFQNNFDSVMKTINTLISKRKHTQAAIFMMKYNSILIDNPKEKQTEVFIIYQRLLRILFDNNHIVTLKDLLARSFGYDEDTLLLSGTTYYLLGLNKEALELFLKVSELCKSPIKKAQSLYYIGQLQNNHEKKLRYLEKCSEYKNNIWSLIASIEIRKNIRTYSIYKLQPINSNSSDAFLKEALQLVYGGKYKKAVSYIYAVKSSHWKEFSPTLLSTIKALVNYTKDKSALHRIGMMIFNNTGFIIEECFPVEKELVYLYKNRKISAKEMAICSGIIERESHFMKHNYHNLDNGQALGVMQIAYREAKIICNNLNIPYSKNLLLNNDLINVIVGVNGFRYNSKFAKKSLIFSIYYYHSGHTSFLTRNKMKFIDFNNISYAFSFLCLIGGKEARYYTAGVLEYYIIIFRLLFGRLPCYKDILYI